MACFFPFFFFFFLRNDFKCFRLPARVCLLQVCSASESSSKFINGMVLKIATACSIVLPAISFIKYLNFKQRPSIGFENYEVPKFQRMITCKVMPAILKTQVPITLLQSDMPRLSFLIFVNVLWYGSIEVFDKG